MTHFLRMIMKNGNLGGDKCQLMEHERTPMMVRLCVCVIIYYFDTNRAINWEQLGVHYQCSGFQGIPADLG